MQENVPTFDRSKALVACRNSAILPSPPITLAVQEILEHLDDWQAEGLFQSQAHQNEDAYREYVGGKLYDAIQNAFRRYGV
jgi:hypothetical protein